MHRKFLITLLSHVFTAMSFSQTPLFTSPTIRSEIYYEQPESVLVKKYAVSANFELISPGEIQSIKCEIVKPLAGGDSVVSSITVLPGNTEPHVYAPGQASYFVENKTVFVFFSPLTTLSGRKLVLSALGFSAQVLQKTCGHLYPIGDTN